MIEIISVSEKDKWDKIVESFQQKDIYYFHGYCSLYKKLGDGQPFLFYYENYIGGKIAYPFIKRSISLPFNVNEQLYDMITPYGYGGPLVENITEYDIAEFRREFEEFCLSENIISEFIRFHPILMNYQLLNNHLDVIYDRETIYIDLTHSIEEIQSKYHTNHLRNLKKGLKNQLEFKVFEKEHALQISEEFYSIYHETMDKLNAKSYYYFSKDYINDLLVELPDQSLIAAVFYNGQMISGALCMFENKMLHYHLGCSKKEYLHLGTNIFQFHQIVCWGKKRGLNVFHLGGGHVGRDSLFQFKHRFNSEGTLEFFVGRKIHNKRIYNMLIDEWEKYYGQNINHNFFPAYRSTPTKRLIKSD